MLIREININITLKTPGEKIKLLETPKAYSTKQIL
jgi:hypothetical protein